MGSDKVPTGIPQFVAWALLVAKEPGDMRKVIEAELDRMILEYTDATRRACDVQKKAELDELRAALTRE